ncbi:hypothetical protein ACJROX_14885 [Pseudalkalibacillus sp. A8]
MPETRRFLDLENDIIKQLDKQAGKEKGKKTRLVNEAIRQYLS